MEKTKIGIYEKALSDDTDLYNSLNLLKETRFDYLEISIDDSKERLQRLDMLETERKALKNFMNKEDLNIYSIVLSANRSYPIGNKDKETRTAGIEIIKKAIDLSYDLDIPVIQLAGYYSFFTDSRDGKERNRFIESLQEITRYSGWKGVMLGLENMDGQDILSIDDSMKIIEDVKSPWLQLYPDIGNLVANGFSLEDELKDISKNVLSIHLKDTRKDEFRRVPFGQGEVNFKLAGELLRKDMYQGNYTIEMWNDGNIDSLKIVNETMEFIQKEMHI